MNIRNLQSNLLKLPEDNLVKFLYDLIMQDIKDVGQYQEDRTYHKGDRVYLQENGKHQIFQCLVDTSASVFIDTEWTYILETYEGNVDKIYNMNLKEEIHYIEEYNREVIYTNLDFNLRQTTVAVYCGKKRYAVNHDFTISGREITFKKPFNIGDRLILEVREVVGVLPDLISIVLYDLNSNPYKVGLNINGELSIEEHYELNESDVKYGEIVTGDRTYTLMVDGGSKPYELKAYRKLETYIEGTNGEIFKVEVIGDKLQLLDCTNSLTAYTDTKYILGLDKKFYTLSLINDKITATVAEDTGLDIRNVDLGLRVLNDKYEARLVIINNGVVDVKEFIDNGGYHNINFIDRATKQIVRMSITDDDSLELNDGIDESGYSGTRFLSYFYFFDEEWTYKRMYVENGMLYYENCALDIIPDSKGINLLRKDGEMVKLRIPHNSDEIHAVRCVSLDNLGTFESPIEGFVVSIDGYTKLITVNKEGTGFEAIDTDLPFRTNHHYIMSTDNKLYKLVFDKHNIEFIEGITPTINAVTYIDADGIYYYLEEGIDSEVNLLMTDELPENAIVGIVVNEYNGIRFRMIDDNGVPVFVRINESYINECEHVICINNNERVCQFTLTNEEFFIKLMDNEAIDYTEEYEIECVNIGAYIKSYERITRFDIVNGHCVLHPISTFLHRIKSDDGNIYSVDVIGEPYEEVLTFKNVKDTEYENLGSGEFYLERTDGVKFIANIDSMGRINFREKEMDSLVDYNITSLVQSSQGLYKIIIEDENIRLEKMFDNMYESDVLSYGNLVKKGLNIQLTNGAWYTFAANGLGEVIIKETDTVDVTGLLLRSDDGYNYGLGMLGEKFVTYKTYVSNPFVHERLYIKDAKTGRTHALFMSGNTLCSEIVSGNNSATQFLIMKDAYKNEFKIEIDNNVLVVSSL